MGKCPACSKHFSEKDVREFFIKRFKHLPEQDQMYYDEWHERILGSGAWRAPEDYMDSGSAKIWHEVTDTDDDIHFGDIVSDGTKEWRVLDVENGKLDGNVRLQAIVPGKDAEGEEYWDEQLVSIKKLQTFDKIEQ